VLSLSPIELSNADEALRYYYRAGLSPILIHAPTGDGNKCTCGLDHKSVGKHPISGHWQKAPEHPIEETQDHLSRLKFQPNIGIVLGKQRGGEYLIAIDVDDEERFKFLLSDIGPLPPTVRGESGRGYRLLFELGEGVSLSKLLNITGLCGSPGVDVKIKGGQVVVAPSTHVSGKSYTWTRFGEIAKLPPTWVLVIEPKDYNVPDWVKEYTPQTIREDHRAKNRAEKYLETAVIRSCALVSSCKEGLRNSTLHRRTISLLALCDGILAHQKWDYVLSELERAATVAGLHAQEIRRTLLSAQKYVLDSGAIRAPVGLWKSSVSLAPGPSISPGPPSAPTSDPTPSTGDSPLPSPSTFPFPDDPFASIHLQDDKGAPNKTAHNVALLLSTHPVWGGGPVYDTYSRVEIWPEPIPEPIRGIHRVEREIVDADYAAIEGWLMSQATVYRVRAGADAIPKGVHLASARKTVDLLKQWVGELPHWDKKQRIASWTVKYLGCSDSPYNRATGRAWLLAVAERALLPGTMVDFIPVMEGKQGSGKNRVLETLFNGGPDWAPWYSKISGHKLDHDNTKRLACTRWILHDDELRATEPKRIEEIKSWASETRETYRLPYAREITVAPRRALLIGSTNRQHYLHDDTGNRRWTPWKTSDRIQYEKIGEDRDQLFAEAFESVRAGIAWRSAITDEIYRKAIDEADQRRVLDPLIEQISEAISAGRLLSPLTTHRIASLLGYGVADIDKGLETRVGATMRELGYESVQKRMVDGKRYREYVKSTTDDDSVSP
jgi:hypothetical protein